MSGNNEIIRIAAKGDGVTADGRHFARAVTGDTIDADGTVVAGPHHVAPPCPHFPQCGGCQLQDADEAALAMFVTDRVQNAARGQEITVGEWLPTHLSPPKSRRRATLHASGGKGRPLIGFRESRSHKIVDMRECHILHPDLFAVVGAIRGLLAGRGGKYAVDIDLTLIEGGVDCGFRNLAVDGLEQTEALLVFARDHALARVTVDHGYGAEAIWEPEPARVRIGRVSVPFPSGSFLQATADGEDVLVSTVRDWLDDSRTVADLFAGLGTFAFGLASRAKVLAVEASRDAHFACKSAAGNAGLPVHSLHRDLFRNPLTTDELNRFDAVILDPPRAGAREQVQALAGSTVGKIAYVSCNPSSWARDAATLIGDGYRLAQVRPVGQFRWATHVELASLFVRDGASGGGSLD